MVGPKKVQILKDIVPHMDKNSGQVRFAAPLIVTKEFSFTKFIGRILEMIRAGWKNLSPSDPVEKLIANSQFRTPQLSVETGPKFSML